MVGFLLELAFGSGYGVKMAKEKFIRGKRDDAHHDGLYSNTKRDQAYQQHLLEELAFLNTLTPQQRFAYLYNGEWDLDDERPNRSTDEV